MPFPDEAFAAGVVVGESASWAEEGIALVDRLRLVVPAAVAVDHIGSTAVPGLPAKDCLDALVRVRDLRDAHGLVAAGYRERPEPWNREEVTDGRTFPKRVFAPPAGERSANVHVRLVGVVGIRRRLGRQAAKYLLSRRAAVRLPEIADHEKHVRLIVELFVHLRRPIG